MGSLVWLLGIKHVNLQGRKTYMICNFPVQRYNYSFSFKFSRKCLKHQASMIKRQFDVDMEVLKTSIEFLLSHRRRLKLRWAHCYQEGGTNST